MSLKFLNSLLEQTVEDLNKTNTDDAKDSAALVTSSMSGKTFKASVPPAAETIKRATIDLSKGLKELETFITKYDEKYTSLELNSLELDTIKTNITNNSKQVVESVLKNIASKLSVDTVTSQVNQAVLSCSSLKEILNRDALVKKIVPQDTTSDSLSSHTAKIIVGKLVPPSAMPVIQAHVESKYVEVVQKVAILIETSNIRSKAKGNVNLDEAASLMVEKITGVSVTKAKLSDASLELLARTKDTKQSLTNMINSIGSKVKERFKIPDKDIRDSFDTQAQILDLKEFERIVLRDLKIYTDNVSKAEEKVAPEMAALLKSKPSQDILINLACGFVDYYLESPGSSANVKKTLDSSKVYCYYLSKYIIVATNITKASVAKAKAKYPNIEEKIHNTYNYANGVVSVNEDNINELKSMGAVVSTDSNAAWNVVKDLTSTANTMKIAYIKTISIPKTAAGVATRIAKEYLEQVTFDPGHINPVAGYGSAIHTMRRGAEWVYKNPGTAPQVDAALNGLKESIEEDIKLFEAGDSGLLAAFNGILKKTFTQELTNNLLREFLYAEAQFTRVLFADGKVRLKFQAQFNTFVEGNPDKANFPITMKAIQDLGLLAVGVRLEDADANRWFGSVLQKKYREAKVVYFKRLIDKIKSGKLVLRYPSGHKDSGKPLNPGDMQGSDSLTDLVTNRYYNLLQFGKTNSVTLESKTKSKKKNSNKVISVTTQSVVILPRKARRRSSSKQTVVVKASVPRIPKEDLSQAKVTTRSKKNTAKPLSTKPAAKTQFGQLSNITSIQNILRAKLYPTIAKNMRYPALRIQTGRFAKSVEIKDVNDRTPGTIDIKYTYMKKPYQTFEPGFRQGSVERDPRALVDKSIREILASQVLQKLRITRV